MYMYNVCVCVCANMHTCVCWQAHVCVCVHAHVFVCMCIFLMLNPHPQWHEPEWMLFCAYVYVCVHACLCVCVCACMLVCVCVCVHAHAISVHTHNGMNQSGCYTVRTKQLLLPSQAVVESCPTNTTPESVKLQIKPIQIATVRSRDRKLSRFVLALLLLTRVLELKVAQVLLQHGHLVQSLGLSGLADVAADDLHLLQHGVGDATGVFRLPLRFPSSANTAVGLLAAMAQGFGKDGVRLGRRVGWRAEGGDVLFSLKPLPLLGFHGSLVDRGKGA